MAFSEPRNDLTRLGVYHARLRDLVVSFVGRALINADNIDPEVVPEVVPALST